MEERIEDRIKTVVIQTLSLDIAVDEIDDHTPFHQSNLALNSISVIQISVALEEEFEIQIPEDDFRLENFISVEKAAEYIRSVVVH